MSAHTIPDSSPAESTHPTSGLTAGFTATFILSVLLGLFFYGTLIYFAGVWNILANTRLLRVLIDSGFVKYHDRDAGFVEGVADHVYYLKSQEPVEWSVVLIAMGIMLFFWVLKGFQFHDIARYHGLPGTFRQHSRAYLVGLTYRKFTPLYVGEAAAAAELKSDGGSTARIRSAIYLMRLFVLFEMAAYALFALLGIGWAAWLTQMAFALMIWSVLYWWTRRAPAENLRVSRYAAREHARALFQRPSRLTKLSLMSLVAFGTEDIVAYLLTMAFSTQQVLLHVDFQLLLIAFVAGYVARLIPLSPGGVGQFEWGFAVSLYLGGMGFPEAATVALLYNGFYYLSFCLLFLATLAWRGAQAPFRSVLRLMYAPEPTEREPASAMLPNDADEDVLIDVPAVPWLRMPPAAQLWRRALIVGWLITALFLFDRLTLLLSDYWLLQSLGFGDVFRTNFRVGAMLFVIGVLVFAAAVTLPAWLHRLPRRSRLIALGLGGLIGLLVGYRLAGEYQTYLLWLNGLPFGQRDPIFGHDIGFFAFSLPAWWMVWRVLVWLFLTALVSSVVCAHVSRGNGARPASGSRVAAWLGSVSTKPVLAALGGLGVILAIGIWLTRYDLLLKEDQVTSVFTGASFIDVDGLFSTLNRIQLTAAVILGLTVVATILLWALHRQASGKQDDQWRRRARLAALVGLALIAADFVFAAGVSIRNAVLVTPNQPVIQLPYIQLHLDATRRAYGLNRVEEIEFTPRNSNDSMPDVNRLLNSGTMRNAPLWPTYVNYLEQLVDPQHAHRILQTGDSMVYGPSLEIFRQQEKLRTYYDFLDVDVLRYTIDGDKIILASSVRELPILEPQPWLAWWGQRFMLFTHGHGLVMAPVGRTTTQGEPVFVSGQIPVEAVWPEVTATNQQVYYGEGNASMAVSNVRGMAELDYPTDQGRAENILPADVSAGVKVDSLLKRIVFGWRSGEFWELVFSSLITPETRVHYFRQPLQRLRHVAPFLYFESNPYATIVDGHITWLVNAVTTSDEYPYSKHEFIGDKSISRSPEVVRTWRVNYVEDSVKATINAATGQVHLYKIAGGPVIDTWAKVYPSLFTPGDRMPQEVRQQITYPLHLFHLQFDDLYIYYHMNDPMYFFNMEDMWDDADEVLGPVLDSGKAITFSMEPYHMLVETGGLLPASTEGQQFVMTQPFTPEGARNLRAIPMVYQDGEDYGRLIVLLVPKGHFAPGPEQADAVIDQDPEISQQISWWNRRGTEVIRGHTSLLLIDDEVIYIEPVFIRSQQNSITQLKRVVIVMRGDAYMAETIEEAVRLAYADERDILATGH